MIYIPINGASFGNYLMHKEVETQGLCLGSKMKRCTRIFKKKYSISVDQIFDNRVASSDRLVQKIMNGHQSMKKMMDKYYLYVVKLKERLRLHKNDILYIYQELLHIILCNHKIV